MAVFSILLFFTLLGASITALFMSAGRKKQAKLHSQYWEKYWYDHFYEIRQTGLTQEQMERMHRLYVSDGKSNDVSNW